MRLRSLPCCFVVVVRRERGKEGAPGGCEHYEAADNGRSVCLSRRKAITTRRKDDAEAGTCMGGGYGRRGGARWDGCLSVGCEIE